MLSRKAIAVAVAVAALLVTAVMIVSFAGNDKPGTEVNIPPNDETPEEDTTPADLPEGSDVPEEETTPEDQAPEEDLPDEAPPAEDEPAEDEQSDEEQGDEDGDDGQGQQGKLKGLQRAIQALERNQMRTMAAGNGNPAGPPGLDQALDVLKGNLEKQQLKEIGQKGEDDQGDEPAGHGQGNGQDQDNPGKGQGQGKGNGQGQAGDEEP